MNGTTLMLENQTLKRVLLHSNNSKEQNLKNYLKFLTFLLQFSLSID
jgi:hypothetical protein